MICAPACETALSPDGASLRAVMESQSKLQARLRQQMIELLLELAPNEGYNLSPLPDIRFLRSNRPLTRTPVLYEPGIVIVCQGRKRGYLGDQVYLYDAQRYLVVSVPLPFSMETDASEVEPLLAIYLRLDLSMAAELMLQLDERDALASTQPRGMATTKLEATLSQSVLRFLQAMLNSLDAEILGPALVREIYFRVFMGEQGGSMRAASSESVSLAGRVSRLSRLIRLTVASCCWSLTPGGVLRFKIGDSPPWRMAP